VTDDAEGRLRVGEVDLHGEDRPGEVAAPDAEISEDSPSLPTVATMVPFTSDTMRNYIAFDRYRRCHMNGNSIDG
jgi:hypothetical protein